MRAKSRGTAWAGGCAVLAGGIATTALLGWNLGYETLMALEPGFIPVQYVTALAFLCCSLSLLALLRGRRAMASIGAASALLLATATGLEYLSGSEFGIDTVFFAGIVADHVAGRMAPNTVAAFLCIALALLVLVRRSPGGSALAVSLAAFVAAVASVALTGYLAGIRTAYQWRGQKPIAALTTVAFLALAVGTMLAAWRRPGDRRGPLPRWLPAPVFVFLMSVCGMIAKAMWDTSRIAVLAEPRRSLVFSMVLMLVFGAAVSTALVGVIRLAMSAQLHARDLERLNQALDVEVEHRRSQQAITEGLNRALRMISACNHAIAHAAKEDDLLRDICELSVNIGGYRLAWIGLRQDDVEKTVRVAAKAGAASEYVTDGFVTWADVPRGQGPTGRAIRNGVVTRCDDVLTDASFEPWRERALQFGFGSSLVLPMRREGRAFGSLSLYAAGAHAFHAEEEALLVRLTEDLTFGIETLRTRQAHERAEERIRFLASIVDSTDDAIYSKSLDGAILSWNPGAVRLYGYGGEEVLGKNIRVLEPEPSPSEMDELLARLGRGESVDHLETKRRRKDGGIVDVSMTLSPVRDRSGRVVAACSIARDISERKRAEAELRRFTAELQRSNAELQEFAFVASHDLQEPLRKITAFSERLRERSAGQLDAVNLDFLNRMHNAATRMSGLIESLLDYSRVATRGVPFAEVDLAQTMLGVLADLEQRIRDNRAQVVVGRLPKVCGDPTQLRQLLQNLVANALKFHAPDRPPRVEIRAFLQESDPGKPDLGLSGSSRWQITVRDEGIGFDPAYAEKIFRPFQRLHGRNEYEGSGMGLAICRKIAQRHGADILVHSEPGKGSTFTVSLSAMPERKDLCPEPQFASSSPRTTTMITC